MNEYDSNRIYDYVKKINYKKTESPQDANCYILNTCHIREKATEKVYHDIGRLKKIFRNKIKPIVLIAGCVAQAEGEVLLKKEKYIDAVVGPQSYHKLNKTIYTQTRNIDEYVSVFADRFLHEQSIEYDFVSAFAARDMDEVESGTYADKVDKLTPLKLLTQLNGIVYLQLRLSNGKASSILRF